MNYKGWVVFGLGCLCLGLSTTNIEFFSWRMLAILISVTVMNLGTAILERKQ